MKNLFTKVIGACCSLIMISLLTTTNLNAQYCAFAGTSPAADYVANVTFAGIDNTTGATGYSDFTDISGVVSPGLDYPVSAILGNGGIWTETLTIYIDWDQSETFDADERYNFGSCTSTGCASPVTGSISVPVDATPGETRMRVIGKFSSPPVGPCTSDGTMTFGEVEDYSLTILSGECTPPNFTYTVINDCEADNYDVSAFLEDFGTNTFITIYITRSDAVVVNPITLIAAIEGQTVPILNNIPFGVTVSASIEGQNSLCNLSRNFAELICPAENDEACTATVLACGDVLTDQVFLGASQSVDDACFGSGTGDVWFTFEADGTQAYTVAETQTDVVVDLWSGDDCGALTQVSACADFPESVTAYDAGTYYFRIRPWSTATTYGVSLTCAPFDCEELGGDIGNACNDGDAGTVNDIITADCECIGEPIAANDEACTATLLVCGDALTSQSFAGSSQSFDDACGGSGLGDVWFTFVADGTQNFLIAETQTDVVVDLWTGTCGDLTPVSACADFPESVNVTEAGTYYFRIRPWGSATTYGVSLTCTPFGCPELLANVGDACDDNNAGTVNDLVTADCECIGVVPATNDEPCTAIALACNDTLVDQTFLGATVSIVDACFTPTNGDVWYSFTAEEGMAYQINEPSSNSTTASLYIAADGDCEDLTEVISCTTFFNTFTITEPGDYFFRIRAYSTAISHSVGFICVDIPENDECDEALPLVCGSTYTGSTLGSVAYSGLPAGTCGTSLPTAGNGGVWHTITPANDTEISLDLSGSSFDTKIFLYTGSCDGLICVDGDDDGGEGLQSLLTATLDAGTTYYIFVSGFGTARGNFILNVSCVDLVCSPTIESAVAVDSEGETLDCVDLNGEYFLEVTLAGGTQASYSVSAGGSPATVINANGTGIVGPVSGINVTVNATGTVNPNCGAAFDYVGIACPPSNDEACNATPISCGETIVQNYVGATLSETCGTGSGTADVWFIFTADGEQTYTIADVGPGFFDAVVGLYQGDDCGNLVSVAPCNDFPESYSVTEAGTYYFYIRPWSSFTTTLTGNVSLTCTPFDCPGVGNFGDPCDDGNAGTVNDEIDANCDCVGEPVVANDEACTATVMECGDVLAAQSFAGSSQSFDDACFGSGTGDVWVTFTADGTQTYTIAETETDVVVDLWSGDDCGNLTPVFGCVDFGENFSVTEAGTYYFRIRPYGTATTYGVSLTCTPFDCPGLGNIGGACDDNNAGTVNDIITAECECIGVTPASNDEPCTAIALACNDTLVDQTFLGATVSIVDACFTPTNGDVWYSFTAEEGMAYQINEPSSNSTTASLYIAADGDCEDLTEVISCTTFFNTFTITEPGDYFFRIRAYSTAISHSVGFICVDIPENDECDEALPLVCGSTYTGSTLGSVAYSGLPAGTCGTSLPTAGNGGVWYVITPTAETEIDLDLSGSDYDTKMFLYTGTCDGLVCVTGDDDGGDGVDSRIQTTLTAGTTYYVFISGFSANRGTYLLNVTCVVENVATLNGTVNWNSNCGDRDATVRFYTPGTSTLIATYNTSVTAAGTFSIPEVVTGTYDVIVKVQGYLAKGFQDVVIANGPNALAVGTIRNGNVNNDNSINIFDLSLINAAFNRSVGHPSYNPLADLNCDGSVNIFDISILNASFNKAGAVAPLN